MSLYKTCIAGIQRNGLCANSTGRVQRTGTSSETRNLEMMQIFYAEAERLSEVLDRILLDERPFFAGEYSIANIMLYPWLVHGVRMNFPAMVSRPRLPAWINRIGTREQVQSGMAAFSTRSAPTDETGSGQNLFAQL